MFARRQRSEVEVSLLQPLPSVAETRIPPISKPDTKRAGLVQPRPARSVWSPGGGKACYTSARFVCVSHLAAYVVLLNANFARKKQRKLKNKAFSCNRQGRQERSVQDGAKRGEPFEALADKMQFGMVLDTERPP
jgi:hypothetical protein